MMTQFPRFALLLGLAAAPLARGDVDPPRRPNIVVVLADDLGYGDVQIANPRRGKIPTPHIDRMAREGMRFTDAHSSSGVCSPSRYSLLTGRYHWRTRLQSGIVNAFGRPLIAPGRLTVASMLKKSGYRTACIGKWHLGWDWPITEDRKALLLAKPTSPGAPPTDVQRELWRATFSQAIPGGPTTRGFDHYFGTDVPNWPPYCFIDDDRTVGIPSEFVPRKLLGNNLASLNGPAISGWTLESILPTLADRASAFIEQAAKGTDPFFLYLPLTTPHTPLAVNTAWKGKSDLNAYADLVMETDAVVGRILDVIDHSGARENTLVIFTSDNGCAPYIGVKELERKGHFPSGPLRGYKSDVWEGGHRVPFLVRWPGVAPAASRCDLLVQQADLMATFADVLGLTLPGDAGEDSVSFLPLLRNGDRPVRTNVVSQSMRGLLAIRNGTWKLILGPGSGGWGEGRDDQPAQLYNLADDIAESRNLYAENPQRVAELTDLMGSIVSRGRSTPGPTQRNDVPVNWTRFLSKRDAQP